MSDYLPVIGITMGDATGVGPEVIVKSLAHHTVYAQCRPLVIGDLTRLRQAAAIRGVTADIVAVEGPDDPAFAPSADRVNVVDLALLPADLPWGAISPVAGDAAYRYIERASEYAMAGDVQAICTAPLNKAALHAAGVSISGVATGGLLAETDPETVGRVALAAGVVLRELRSGDERGLEEMFLDLTAASAREEVAA